MLSWKRQRKHEEPLHSSSPSSTGAGLEVECAPLGCSPDGVVDAPPGLHPSTSRASSMCSEDEECLDLGPPPHNSSSGGTPSSSSTSIELAARPAGSQLALQQQQGQQEQQGQHGEQLGSSSASSGVRAKAAYFEALIRCNTTAHIQCSADGAAHCSSYSPGCSGSADHAAPMLASPRATRSCDASEAHLAGIDAAAGAAFLAGPMGGVQEGAERWDQDDFSEVHMVLRMPRQRASPAGGRYGSVEEMEALIEQLQGALEVTERQRKAAVDAYQRRTGECENLTRVVRELTESRSKAVSQRASLAERYAELQQEYHRMLRIADLSRTVSKENLANTSRTRSELRRVQLELHATKSHAQRLSEKNKKVRVQNAMLKEKVTLLERLDFEEVQESECKKVFTRYRLAETY